MIVISKETKEVLFTDLQPDTKYSLKIHDILYDNYIVSDDYSVEISAKTLKEKPTIGDLAFAIDKKGHAIFVNRLPISFQNVFI